jgi:hypothetical protein
MTDLKVIAVLLVVAYLVFHHHHYRRHRRNGFGFWYSLKGPFGGRLTYSKRL